MWVQLELKLLFTDHEVAHGLGALWHFLQRLILLFPSDAGKTQGPKAAAAARTAGCLQKLRSTHTSWSHSTPARKKAPHLLRSPLAVLRIFLLGPKRGRCFHRYHPNMNKSQQTNLRGRMNPGPSCNPPTAPGPVTFAHSVHLLHIFLELQAGFAEDTAARLAHLCCQEGAFAGSALAWDWRGVSSWKLCAIQRPLGAIRSLLDFGLGSFIF